MYTIKNPNLIQNSNFQNFRLQIWDVERIAKYYYVMEWLCRHSRQSRVWRNLKGSNFKLSNSFWFFEYSNYEIQAFRWVFRFSGAETIRIASGNSSVALTCSRRRALFLIQPQIARSVVSERKRWRVHDWHVW